MDFAGVVAALGLGTLSCFAVLAGLVLAVPQTVVKGLFTVTTMPIKPVIMSVEEADAAFKRTRSADEVSEWVDMLRESNIAIGSVFKFPVHVEIETSTDANGKEIESEVLVLDDSTSTDDPDGITVRTAKRRFNAAAKQLGFNLSWKEPKGWLIAKAVSTTVETQAAPTSEPASQPAAPTSEPAQAAPQNGPAANGPASAAQMPANTPRRRRPA